MVDLRVSIGPLTLRNPVMVAAGTFGYGPEFAGAVRLDRLGALITKTLTRQPRAGNRPPRLAETPSGMLNAVGLHNIGLEAFVREQLPRLIAWRVPILVSVLGETPQDTAEMVAALDGEQGVAGMEINLSCPNLHREQNGRHVLMVAQDAEETFRVIQAARQRTRKPLVAKLSPDVTDVRPIAQAAERAGADALSIGNTFAGMSFNPATRRSRLGAMTGGLSGPAIRPLALYRVWYTAAAVRIPIIGVGGIVRAEDAVEFLLAGASAVAIGTATFADPRAALHVVRGLERYLRRHRLDAVAGLRGAVSAPDFT